jgi:gliding motility-associated-like protein
MKKNYKKTFWLASILFLFLVQLPNSIFATHVQGGDITYKCLGGNQYQLSMALYRDCAGVVAPGTLTVNVKSATCGQDFNVTLNPIPNTGIEVSPICPSLKTVCAGGTYPGVEEYIYSGIVTLPAQCTDWVFSANIKARNSAISTIDNPAAQNLYIESHLDNLNYPCNNSPTFTNKPVPFICVGQPFCFNNGALDADGDSLYYALVTPMNGPGSTVLYNAPYSATQPLLSSPPVSFNPATGDICMTPTQLEVTVFSIIVKEYRNGIQIGSIVRDIQLRTVTCNNSNPILTGINGTGSFSTSGCIGTPITFNIPSDDADAGQSLVLTWNSGIAGGVFNPGTGAHPTATFTWTPTLADLNNVSNCFTVRVKDDNCPFNGSQTYSFCITLSTVNATITSKDANCTASNGSATVVAADGTPPYTYSWAPSGGTGATTVGIPAGTYTCTVTDKKGCSKQVTAVVKSIPGGTASISSFSNISCNGATDGSITVSMSGGATPPFTYVWNPNVGTTATVNNLPVGTYTVTITDAFGCIATATQAIIQPNALVVTPTNTNVSCYNGANGTATASVSGGTPPYTYSWSPGGFLTSSISNLSIGTYTVNVTDSKGCKKSATVTISQPPILAITPTTVDATCGKSNGSASVTGAGGFPPYTWTWSGGQTTSNITNLAAGTYTVTIHDVSLCAISAPVTIKNIAGPTAIISATTMVACSGGNTGSSTVTVTGGKPPYTYLWNNGQTTPTATNLVAGIYSVVATDANGCAATANVTITQPTVLIANITGTSPVCFNDKNGTATVSATGGTAPYTYLWALTGSHTKDTIQNVGAGIYNVTVTDAKGCSKVATVTLVNPKIISTSVISTKALCFGGCTGTATATVTNGFTPLTYLWNNSTAQTTATATGLCAGTYSVAVKDAHGCKSQASTTITAPTLLTSAISLSGNAKCFGGCDGFAQVTSAGGTPPYSYSWTGGANTATATSLCAGSYTCTTTDANGCTSTATVVITQPTKLNATITAKDLRCNGACDGAGNISFSGGVSPYTFLWTPGLQTTFNPSDLCLGSNTATITDANGCKVSSTVVLTQPAALNVTTTITPSACGQYSGSACANVSGGAAPYTYVWDTLGLISSLPPQTQCITNMKANTYTVTVTDANGCIVDKSANINDLSGPTVNITSSTDLNCNGGNNGTATAVVTTPVGITYTVLWSPGGQTTQIPTNLSAGINSIIVKDSHGCTASASVDINEPTAIVTVISSLTNVTCNGNCDGTSTILYTGGTPPLTVKWTDPLGQTTDKAVGLCAGTYTVTVTDSKGCKIANSATIITQPNALTISSSTSTDIKCNGDNDGSISAVTAGGTPFYTYAWAPSVSSGNTATNLAPGSYKLIVSDMNGCLATKSWTIKEPPKLLVSDSFKPATCSKNNGEGTVVATGGTPVYNYQWNDPLLQKVPVAKNLYMGTYVCVITDAFGCTVRDTVNIVDEQGPVIDSMKSTPALCFGDNTGTATVKLKPGTGKAPITYLWTSISQTNPIALGLIQGPYSVVVTDGNGCTTNGTVFVNQASKLMLSVGATDSICFGEKAQIYAQAVGGTPAYTYTWPIGSGLSGSGPHLVQPPITTIYPVSVKDANGCGAGPLNIVVIVRPPIDVKASDIAICEGTSGTISAVVSGGKNGPYTYQWSNGPTTKSQVVSPKLSASPAKYIVTVNDGCSTPAYDTSTVIVNPGSVGVLIGSDTLGCEPLKVTFNAVSNNGITYLWEFGDGTSAAGVSPTHIYENDGVYTVTVKVKTGAGCITPITDTNYITVYPVPTADFTSDPTSTTFINPIVNFKDLSAPDITMWNWNFNDPTSTTSNTSKLKNPTHVFTGINVYNVRLIVTTKYGCIDTVNKFYEVGDDFVFYIPNAFTPNEDGINEMFMPKGIGFDKGTFHFYIYDRWGNFIFYSDDPAKGWDGRANHGVDVAQQDVFVWKIDLKDNSGRTHKYMGHVTIVK